VVPHGNFPGAASRVTCVREKKSFENFKNKNIYKQKHMDGLALYRLKHLPQKRAKKRKALPTIVEKQSEKGVEYMCPNCNANMQVITTTVIQCKKCDWRILEKRRVSNVIVNAV
jgi:DNA-directed RNA polymerase subunit RPC12/RpoP